MKFLHTFFREDPEGLLDKWMFDSYNAESL